MHPQSSKPHATVHARGRRVCFLERESDLTLAETAIETQHHALSAEAARRGDRVVRVVVAAGYSGSLQPTERPDFEEILDAAERAEFDYVLATEIARVNRGEAYSYYYLKHELARYGIGLEFLDQQFTDDGESEVGALMEGFSVLLPSIEKRTIVRRFKRARVRMQEEGFQWTGVSPFGYEYVKGGQKNHQWRIVPDEAEWVKKIFTWAAAGIARKEIARRLNEAGVPTRREGKWWPSTVTGIIRNPRYKGCWPQHRYQTVQARPEHPYKPRPHLPHVKHHHKKRLRVKTSHVVRPESEWGTVRRRPELAIVDEETWARANAMAERNRSTAARRTREPGLLKGLVYREHDQDGTGPRSMYYDRCGTRQPRYRCSYRRAPGGPRCTHSVLAPDVEARVWATVCDLATAPERLLDDFLAGAQQRLERLRRIGAQRAAADAQVSRLETALATLDVAHASGEMDEGRYRRAAALAEENLRRAREAQQRLLEDAEAGRDGAPNPLIDALIRATDALDPCCRTPEEVVRAAVASVLGTPTRAELEALSPEEKRRRVRCCAERVVYGPEGVSLVLALGGERRIVDSTRQGSDPRTRLADLVRLTSHRGRPTVGCRCADNAPVAERGGGPDRENDHA